MQFSSQFSKFIDEGVKPSSAQEQSAILDEARSVILDISRRAGTGELRVATLDERVAANSEKLASNKKRPIYNRQPQASAPAKPSSPAPVATAKPSTAPATASPSSNVRTRAQFDAMSPEDRNVFMRSGGKLI